LHRKTWTKDGDPRLFWPQEWLPRDQDFKDVRIHMFGYDANWGKESILNIHDFAKDLLAWLKDSPAIPREDNVSFVYSLDNLPTTRGVFCLSPEDSLIHNLSCQRESNTSQSILLTISSYILFLSATV
jgi:hypothetical protein